MQCESLETTILENLWISCSDQWKSDTAKGDSPPKILISAFLVNLHPYTKLWLHTHSLKCIKLLKFIIRAIVFIFRALKYLCSYKLHLPLWLMDLKEPFGKWPSWARLQTCKQPLPAKQAVPEIAKTGKSNLGILNFTNSTKIKE